VRVLVAHSRYLSGVASGENQVVDDEIRLLERAGHAVRRWEPSPDTAGALSLLRTGAGTVWSVPAVRRLRVLLDETGAEVLHCHNLFPALSPAVLRAADEMGVAVVVTLHNYRLLCLPADFLRDDRVCEDCLGHVPWRGVVRRCYRDSTLGSAALAGSLTLHRMVRTFERPKLFLAVSEFVRTKHVAAGLPSDRIRVKSNFAWACARREGAGDYFLFVGRLSREKGLEPLLRAWAGIDARLVVVGDGPDRERLLEIAPSSVEFAGSLPRDDVDHWLRGARALVVPSICYEGQPRTILEAFAAGVPVIASRMGGIPEVVLDGVSGRLVDPHEPQGWRDVVDAMQDDDEVRRLGDGAFDRWCNSFSPEIALEALERAYRDAVQGA
jgi:glycosyltransferase involved in cell wall biosynthesis